MRLVCLPNTGRLGLSITVCDRPRCLISRSPEKNELCPVHRRLLMPHISGLRLSGLRLSGLRSIGKAAANEGDFPFSATAERFSRVAFHPVRQQNGFVGLQSQCF